VEQLWVSAKEAVPVNENSRAHYAFYAALATGFRSGSQHIFDHAYYGLDYAACASGSKEAEWTAQAAIVKEIFGNPFRPIPLAPAWRTPTVTALAQAAYDERILPAGTLDPDRLAVLADALEEAGCDNDDILSHLRGPGPHVRGCWAVDLLLGKE